MMEATLVYLKIENPRHVEHTLNPSTWEAETTGSVRVRGQLGLHEELQDSQGYIVRPCLNEKETSGEGKKGKEREGKVGRTPKSEKQTAESFNRKPSLSDCPSPSLLLSHSEVRETSP